MATGMAIHTRIVTSNYWLSWLRSHRAAEAASGGHEGKIIASAAGRASGSLLTGAGVVYGVRASPPVPLSCCAMARFQFRRICGALVPVGVAAAQKEPDPFAVSYLGIASTALLSVRGSMNCVLDSSRCENDDCRQRECARASCRCGGRLRARHAAPVEFRQQRLRRRPRVAVNRVLDRHLVSSFGASISTCATTAPGAISLPFLVVHCVKLAPNPRMKSLSAIRSSATGEENPPLMPTDQGFFARYCAAVNMKRALFRHSVTGAFWAKYELPPPIDSLLRLANVQVWISGNNGPRVVREGLYPLCFIREAKPGFGHSEPHVQAHARHIRGTLPRAFGNQPQCPCLSSATDRAGYPSRKPQPLLP